MPVLNTNLCVYFFQPVRSSKQIFLKRGAYNNWYNVVLWWLLKKRIWMQQLTLSRQNSLVTIAASDSYKYKQDKTKFYSCYILKTSLNIGATWRWLGTKYSFWLINYECFCDCWSFTCVYTVYFIYTTHLLHLFINCSFGITFEYFRTLHFIILLDLISI